MEDSKNNETRVVVNVSLPLPLVQIMAEKTRVDFSNNRSACYTHYLSLGVDAERAKREKG
jgi:hypothetical protein